MEDNRQNITESGDKSQKMNFMDIFKILWNNRKKILISSLIGAAAGLIIAFSIPKTYTTQVTLAPEFDEGGGGGMGSLASLAGLSSAMYGSDAYYPTLYPDIVQSSAFCFSLLDVPLKTMEGQQVTLEEYLRHHTSKAWWSVIIGAPGKLMKAFKSKQDFSKVKDQFPVGFRLTEKQEELIERLNGNITADVDNKTNVVTVSVSMQDPLLSALLADTVVNRLQEFVTDYRTNKARHDLEYVQMLNDEAKEKYYKAQQKFADYLDANQGMILFSARTERDRLENEATLAFNLFNQTEQHLQRAKAKVQENTPVFAVIQPSRVPLKPSAPRKVLILIGCTMLGFLIAATRVILTTPVPVNKQ